MDLSVQEEENVKQSLVTHANPSPEILIKYHNIIIEKGEFILGY